MSIVEEEEEEGGWKGIEGARFESGLFLFVFPFFRLAYFLGLL